MHHWIQTNQPTNAPICSLQYQHFDAACVSDGRGECFVHWDRDSFGTRRPANSRAHPAIVVGSRRAGVAAACLQSRHQRPLQSSTGRTLRLGLSTFRCVLQLWVKTESSPSWATSAYRAALFFDYLAFIWSCRTMDLGPVHCMLSLFNEWHTRCYNWQCSGQELNAGTVDCESIALTATPHCYNYFHN